MANKVRLPCKFCGGKGTKGFLSKTKCQHCNGEGGVSHPVADGWWHECRCKGIVWCWESPRSDCIYCKGAGWYFQPRPPMDYDYVPELRAPSYHPEEREEPEGPEFFGGITKPLMAILGPVFRF